MRMWAEKSPVRIELRSLTLRGPPRNNIYTKEKTLQTRPELTAGEQARTRLAAAAMAAFAATYALLGGWYLYHDFFKFLGRNAPTTFDGSGYAVAVNCQLMTVLSPWRLGGLILAVALLAVSARRLLRGHSGARALSLFTLWGVVLPQLFWYTEFVVDWRAGFGLSTTVLAGLALVLVPTALMFEGKSTLSDWRRVSAGRFRLLLTAVASAWVAFGATEFIDHSYQLNSSMAYGGALTAAILGIIGAFGLMRLRVWGLFAVVAAAASLALVPLAFNWTPYMFTGGYIDSFVVSTSGSGFQSVLAAAMPLALVGACAAPFLKSVVQRMRA